MRLRLPRLRLLPQRLLLPRLLRPVRRPKVPPVRLVLHRALPPVAHPQLRLPRVATRSEVAAFRAMIFRKGVFRLSGSYCPRDNSDASPGWTWKAGSALCR